MLTQTPLSIRPLLLPAARPGLILALFAAAFVAATVADVSAEPKKGLGSEVEIYLEIPDIPGGVTTKGFENQIAITAFSWGASNSSPAPGTGGGGGAGKADLEELALTKSFDSTSPEFFFRTVTGRHFPAATLRVVRSVHGVRKEYLTIAMQDVIITSIQLGQATGTGENTVPESITLAFASVKVIHTGSDRSVTEKSWSVATNSSP